MFEEHFKLHTGKTNEKNFFVRRTPAFGQRMCSFATIGIEEGRRGGQELVWMEVSLSAEQCVRRQVETNDEKITKCSKAPSSRRGKGHVVVGRENAERTSGKGETLGGRRG